MQAVSASRQDQQGKWSPHHEDLGISFAALVCQSHHRLRRLLRRGQLAHGIQLESVGDSKRSKRDELARILLVIDVENERDGEIRGEGE